MRVKAFIAAALLTVACSPFAATPAQAGPLADELSRCLVTGATEAEKTQLARWIFGAISTHPRLADLAAVTAGERARLNEEVARIFERLMIEACPTEARAAFGAEGPAAIGKGFETLGELAIAELLVDPDVIAATEGVAGKLDQERLGSFLLEAEAEPSTKQPEAETP